jgi:hypothetical protein
MPEQKMNEINTNEQEPNLYMDEALYKKLFKFFKNRDIFLVLLYIFLMHLPPSYVFVYFKRDQLCSIFTPMS